MAKKYGLIIDITRCDGCGSCLIAVKDEYAINNYPGYCAPLPMEGVNLLDLKEVEQGQHWKVKMDYIPVMFPHNRNQEPIPGAPEGAVYVREDGITIIDPVKAKGCKAIYDYFNAKYPGTVYWNEEQQLPQIYILDAHRLDEGEKLTRCAESCPTQALHWGDYNDPDSEVSQFIAEHGEDSLEDYFQEEGADFVVRYYKLPKPFITGEVLREDLLNDCVEGAKVTCRSKCGCVRETTTNFFGDFEFMYLTRGGEYDVTMEVEGYEPKTISVKLDEATDLGTVVLKKK